MTETTNVRNRIASIEPWITKINKWFSYIAAGCACLTMLISVADVIGVKLFKWSIPSSVEYIEELMVFSVFLCIAYVELDRGHIRVNILDQYIPRIWNYSFRVFGHLVGILVIGFLSWRSYTLLEYSITTQLSKTGTIRFPLWPSHLAVFIGFTCLTIVYILLFSKAIITRPEK